MKPSTRIERPPGKTQLLLLSMLIVTSLVVNVIDATGTTTTKQASGLQTSPSTTSIHQVWTSTSTGGRLDELSPEMIGKLRNDVPFLAAYALRPRLVGFGGSSESTTWDSGRSANSAEPAISGQLQAPVSREAGEARLMSSLQTSGSSPQRSQSLVPQLGDFSEFNVETLSTSKSEHQHKRRTSLKRNDELNKKKRMLATASRLIKKQKSGVKSGKSKKQRKGTGRLVAGGKKRRDQTLLRSQVRAGRLRQKVNRVNLMHHMNIIRHGRYAQLERQTDARGGNTVAANDEPEADVKGGASGRGDKKPFYSNAANPAARERGDDDDASPGVGESPADADKKKPDQRDDGGERDLESGKGSRSDDKSDKPITEVDDDEDIDDEGSPLASPIPKRVGDGDVDEEMGDTVTVMPKSDGVDDDPDPAEFEPEAPAEDDENDVGSGGASSSGGAGIGTTIGGNGGTGIPVSGSGSGSRADGNNVNNVDEEDDDSQADSGSTDINKNAGTGGKKSSPGVEFADDKDKDEKDGADTDDDDNGDGERRGNERSDGKEESRGSSGSEPAARGNSGSRGSASGVSDTESDDGHENGPTSKERRPKVGGGKEADVGGDADNEDDEDLDYRDELDGSRKSGAREGGDSSRKVRPMVGVKNDTGTHHGDSGHHKSSNCDDGSYSHHDDHHHHGGHDHGDSIKWLQDAIPGEPNEDYPILSRANLTTNFNCRDQKYPGYYADVEARCQVFHICQADGRQDSFLCPNGTIFSQITTVCVWWNSFDCEDAPKYYKLNALLYKSSPNNPAKTDGTANSLRPVDGASRMASTTDADEDEASIDSLIRAMRRKEADAKRDPDERVANDAGLSETNGRGFGDKAGNGASSMKIDNIGPDDEATIQRKSNVVTEDVDNNQRARLVKNLSSRSRALSNNAEPRRKRRASVRQAPPKLKSRRFARPSRRWKLRHNPKPKRRA